MSVKDEIDRADAGLTGDVARFGDYLAKRTKERARIEAEEERAKTEALENVKLELGRIIENIFDCFGGREAFEEDSRRLDDLLKASLPEKLRQRHEDIYKRLDALYAAGKRREDDAELSKAYVALVQDPVYASIFDRIYRADIPSLETERRDRSPMLVIVRNDEYVP